MAKWTETSGLTVRQAIDIPPVWLLGMLALVWLSTHVLPGLTVRVSGLRILGALSTVAGVALMFWAVAAFRAHQTSVVPHQVPRQIITSGPFAITRNPIYLGDVLVLIGAILWWGAWPAVILIPVFAQILARRFIAPEEARMKQNFGPEFDEYSKKMPRWVRKM